MSSSSLSPRFLSTFLPFRINFTVISGGPGGILDQFYNH